MPSTGLVLAPASQEQCWDLRWVSPSQRCAEGLPRPRSGKEPTCPCRTCQRCGLIPGWEGPLEGAWQPAPVFLPGESHGQRGLAGYSPWGHRVRQDWSNLACTHTHTMVCKRQAHPNISEAFPVSGIHNGLFHSFAPLETFYVCVCAGCLFGNEKWGKWMLLRINIMTSIFP